MLTPSPDHPQGSLPDLIQQLSARYVRGASFSDIFEALMPDLLAFTGSTMGFIGRLCEDPQSQTPYLEMVAHGGTALPPVASSDNFRPCGQVPVVLRDFNSPFGQVVASGCTVIRHSGAHNARSSSGFWDSLGIEQFLGVPLFHGGTLVGLVALANRPAGYDEDLVRELQPVVDVLSNIVGAIDLERARREAMLEQTLAQTSLERNEAHYRAIFEAAGVGIALLAPDGRLLDVNQRYASICQRPRADLLGCSCNDFTHAEDLPVKLALMDAALQGHQDRFTLDHRYVTPNEHTVWVQVNAVLVRDAHGAPLHFVAVTEDISERKRYQEALLSAQAAERASKAKTEFLSRMSHELRTPLNAMLGFAQLLRVDPRHPLEPAQQQKVRYIEQAGAHLLAMLTDVLDLSRIEAGSLPLSLEPLRLGEVIQEALTMVGHQASERKMQVEVGGFDARLHVRADQLRLRQILVNLLSNAIKYNRLQGHVRIEVEVQKPQVLVAVHDSGTGLTQEQQRHLFEPFNRLGAEHSDIEGTGIGLVIVKRLVSLMQGRIEVQSVPGQGSVFRVLLPWADAPQAVIATHDMSRHSLDALNETGAPTAARLRLIYAEDNVVNVELLRHVMHMRPQWHVDVANNGTDAIDMVLAQPPDLLLLDMHLGDMSGLDVADALACHPHVAHVIKVALSADVMPDQLKAAKDRGFVDYLTKPMDVPRILTLLDSFEAPPPTAPSATPPSHPSVDS